MDSNGTGSLITTSSFALSMEGCLFLLQTEDAKMVCGFLNFNYII